MKFTTIRERMSQIVRLLLTGAKLRQMNRWYETFLIYTNKWFITFFFKVSIHFRIPSKKNCSFASLMKKRNFLWVCRASIFMTHLNKIVTFQILKKIILTIIHVKSKIKAVYIFTIWRGMNILMSQYKWNISDYSQALRTRSQ